MGIRVNNKIESGEDRNPWTGLSSYEDPEKAEREGFKPKQFCGRDDESHQMAQLVSTNIFVTLYGKSGTGKTSLLNAGVFPRLRQRRYLPVSIRLSMDALDITFQQAILRRLSKAVSERDGQQQTIEVVPLPSDEQQPDYLWSYFARTRFLDNEGRTLFPVIVLDQFEEVFRNRRDEAEVLLRQIAYLMDESHALTPRTVDGQPYKYNFNFRFIASIREDDLYRLEDSIDNNYLSELKRCRYRLRSLSEDGARDAILIPGKGLFNADEKYVIAETIISKSRNDDGSISTNIISLLCSRIYVDFKKSGADYISPSLVDNFIKGNPFERFYNEATQGFSNKEKSYIEDNLVDSTGRRNSIPEIDFYLHVKNGSKLLKGKSRILQCISTSSDGKNSRIELIHDSFCGPLSIQKEKREKRKRRLQMVGIAGIAVFSFCIIAFILYQMHKVETSNWIMKENQARFVAEKASSLVDEGDSYLARLLCINILPSNLEDPDIPYEIEAEIALRKAMKEDNAVLRGHTSAVWYVSLSPDGKKLASASSDETIRIWDVETGKNMLILNGHKDRVNTASFSPDGRSLVSASSDHSIRIWNSLSGKIIKVLNGHNDRVNSALFSPDGKLVLSASYDKTVRLWDCSSGQELKTFDGHTEAVNYASFSPNSMIIASAAKDNTIRIWNIETGKCLRILEGHTGPY
jgi:WD40 repeat protein